MLKDLNVSDKAAFARASMSPNPFWWLDDEIVDAINKIEGVYGKNFAVCSKNEEGSFTAHKILKGPEVAMVMHSGSAKKQLSIHNGKKNYLVNVISVSIVKKNGEPYLSFYAEDPVDKRTFCILADVELD